MNDETPNTGVSNETTDPAASEADRPAQRILIGSQRDRESVADMKAKPVTPAAPLATPPEEGSEGQPAPSRPAKKQPPKHYPPPNIRDQLSPELQAEYEAALGELSLDALMSASSAGEISDVEPETRVKGRVSRVARDDVFVDFDGRNQGVVPLRQFDTQPKEGDELELIVVRFDNEEGFYELSLPTAAVDVGNWSDVSEGQIIEVAVTGANKGGLECQVAGIRGFHVDGLARERLNIAARLAGVGDVQRNSFLLRLTVDGYVLTVFPDGRTIVGGTGDIATARSLHARYIGA